MYYGNRKLYTLLALILFIFPVCQQHGIIYDIVAKERRASALEPDTKQMNKIRSYLKNNDINGSIAVMSGNKLIVNEGNGFADFEKKIRNHPETTFPIASITKSLVATSFMQLEERGLVNLQDPVSKYIDHFPNGENITIQHLLTNTSGIRPLHSIRKNSTPKDIIEEIKKRPVRFQAGTRWDYKDTNYMVLGYILEKITGIALHAYIDKNIFKRASMNHSGFISKENPIPYAAVGYFKDQNQFQPVKEINIFLLYGAGDIYSTASDLCKYDLSLMNGQLISKKSLRKMLRPGSKSGYGLGMYVKHNYIFSRGYLGGWNSIHVIFNGKTSVVVLLNVRNQKTDILKIAKDIYRLAV